MNATDEAMLQIMALDSSASLHYSTFTHKWYVRAKIEVSDGGVIGGITQHADSPESACVFFVNKMKSIAPDEVLVTDSMSSERSHWRWNGAAFAPQSVPTGA